MSKHNPLLDELRVVIRRFATQGGGRASDAADAVIKAKPKLFADYANEYARARLVALARREMKFMADDSLLMNEAAPLFRGMRLDRIPAAICVPTEDGDSLYRPIKRARIGELRDAIKARRKQIVDDTAAVDRLMELLDLRLSQGAADDDLVIPENKPDRKAA